MKSAYSFLAATLCLLNPTFAADFKFDASGSEALYQTPLPKAVYQSSRVDSLQDITITNAAGEQVPYAILDHTDINRHTITTQDEARLTIFTVKEKSLNNVEDLTIQLQKNAANTSLNISLSKAKEHEKDEKIVYLVDLGKQHQPLQTMAAEWQGDDSSFFTLEFHASDDLKNWNYAGSAVFLKTADDGKTLIQNNVTLDNPTAGRYLKIVPQENESGSFTLKHLNAVYNAVKEIEYALYYQDLDFLQREQDDKKGLINVDFESGGRYPASMMRVYLPQANAITNLTIFSRNKNDGPWRSYGSFRLQFSAKSKMPNTDEVVLMTSAARYWRLQFNQASGGLGKENPGIALGWYPKTLVWNARGQAPFTLHVGDKPAIVNTMPVTDLISDYSPEKARQLPKSNLMVETANESESISKVITEPVNTVENSWISAPDYKNWLLWGGLLLGVLILAFMAYSLLKKDLKE